MRARRRAAAIAVTIAVALTPILTGCTQLAESALPSDDCTPSAAPGAASDAVVTSGAFGWVADPSFPTPLRADTLQVSRSGAGTGDPVTTHGVLSGFLQVLDAGTGGEYVAYAPIRSGDDSDGAPITVTSLRSHLPGLADAVQCARAGERVTAVLPATELLGAPAASQLADPSATMIAIVDVTRVYPSSASGVVLPPEDGIPAVVAAPSGQPGVTMPQQLPPTTQLSSLRISGLAEPVVAGEIVTLHASIFSWETGEQLGSSWDPSNSVLQLPALDGPTADGLFGATSALVGQPVGSQVIVIVPPEQAHTFEGPIARFASGNNTLVLVIDILAAEPAGA